MHFSLAVWDLKMYGFELSNGCSVLSGLGFLQIIMPFAVKGGIIYTLALK